MRVARRNPAGGPASQRWPPCSKASSAPSAMSQRPPSAARGDKKNDDNLIITLSSVTVHRERNSGSMTPKWRNEDKCERPRAGARSYAIRGAEPRDQARREEVADIRRHRKHTRDCGCDSLSSSGVGHDSSPYP